MSRPIWKGIISFGLVNIPVTLHSAENRSESIHFHMLDRRNHARIHYSRINEKTGKVVPWEEIVKAYEFEKENYIIVDEKELEKRAAESSQTVTLENFIDQASLDPAYFEKPYYLMPSKQGEKGYLLLRETLENTQKVGIAKVVIKTRQHLAALMAHKNVLILNLMRFPNELVNLEKLDIAQENLKTIKISAKEIEMAEKLVKQMTVKWNPKKYHDTNRELLKEWIEKKIKRGKAVASPHPAKTAHGPKGNVIDFMELLKKSIQTEKKHTEKKHKPAPNAKKHAKKAK